MLLQNIAIFIKLIALIKSDKAFFEENKSQIKLYEKTLSELKKTYVKTPSSKDILSELDVLHKKRITLCKIILLQNPI